jgi:Dyp-type peroxidase family
MPNAIILSLAALILVGAIGAYFWYCTRKGICPIPHTWLTSLGFRHKTVGRSIAPPQQAVPLAVTDPNRAALLADLQGNILAGHGRDNAVHLFIKFTSETFDARMWLRETAESFVVSAQSQLQASRAFRQKGVNGGIFGHISLSAAGYRALGFDADELPTGLNPQNRPKGQGYSDVFAAGMKSRQRLLMDPALANWDSGFQSEIHAVVILAGDSAADVGNASDYVVQSLYGFGKVVARETGLGLTRLLNPNDAASVAHVEHFGYVDGRSQPLFLEEQVEAEKSAGGASVWDPSAPLSLVLVRDPLGKDESSCGSFLVFRKLEQNVRGWNRAVAALAQELGVKQELAGAMSMGRFKDGTPVVAQGTSGRSDVHNDFDFSSDPSGLRCPFQAHIRKTNPRGEAIGVAGDKTLESERGHRIARRGIPYGGRLTTSSVPEEQPEGGVGLLFMCYQSDIWEQFEFIQRRWSNNPFFLQPAKSKAPNYGETGLDPVIGQTSLEFRNAPRPAANWPKGWGKETTKVDAQMANFVTLKGGEYFFSPSISFLLGL